MIAMVNITMAFTLDGTMTLVYKDMDTDWPSGLVHKVVKELRSKYQMEDTMIGVELRQMFDKVSMKRNYNSLLLHFSRSVELTLIEYLKEENQLR
jgi:hypothetical protein